MELSFIVAFLVSLNSLHSFIHTIAPIVLFILSFFDIRLFEISNKDKINYFKNKIKNNFSTRIDDNNKPLGWLIGYNFIAYYDKDNYLTILTTKKIKTELFNNSIITLNNKNEQEDSEEITNKLINEDDDNSEIKEEHIKLFTRYGTYEYLDYTNREINMTNYDFKNNQKKLSIDIINKYEIRNNLTAFISGEIGAGKSMFGKLLAKKLNANFVDDFNPSEPGDTLEYLYTLVRPTHSNPLVIVLDEIDILIETFHNGNVIQHKKITKLVNNKTTWNKFLDKIEIGLYPHIILLLCSNKSKKYIDNLDPSYLRDGRVHHYAELKDEKKND